MVVVAGHICLDLFPGLEGIKTLAPGKLIEVGPIGFSAGGTVSNVGVALHVLGTKVRIAGKIGRDDFGEILYQHFRYYHIERGLIQRRHEETSYSIVISLEGSDRTFLHFPGCNDTFSSFDIDNETLLGSHHLHFGYPPLMKAIRENDGEELVEIFDLARRKKKSTSLDMSLPDPQSAQGQIDWAKYLSKVLPYVDFFMPSDDELAFMLPNVRNTPEDLAAACLDMGAGVVVVKRGEKGLFARAGSQERLAGVRTLTAPEEWAGRTLMHPCFEAKVVGTTGSGDATIAGFLHGLSGGFSFEKCLEAGCAVGAFSVEAADSINGIKSWHYVQQRLEKGWRKLA